MLEIAHTVALIGQLLLRESEVSLLLAVARERTCIELHQAKRGGVK